MNTDEIAELITRRRRQLLVHSIIYYRFGESIISDYKWAEWAFELEALQAEYPEIAASCPRAHAFADFDHSTGYNLPLTNPNDVALAKRLIDMHYNGVPKKHIFKGENV